MWWIDNSYIAGSNLILGTSIPDSSGNVKAVLLQAIKPRLVA